MTKIHTMMLNLYSTIYLLQKPLWLHCIVILKLKVDPYWTLVTF